MRLRYLLAPAALTLVGTAPPAPDPVSIPIRDIVLSNGQHRYAVTITVNGRRIEAGLDSGSTGLRIMARGLPGVSPGGREVHYGYGSGTQLIGDEAQAAVGFGTMPAVTMPVQRVAAIACLANKPSCPATRNNDPATFGIQGDGLPNQGFVAILGIGIARQPIPNPLQAAGAGRWIIILPTPGGAPGALILNPNPAQIADFSSVPLSEQGNLFPACLTLPKSGRICAPARVDTGAPGLRIVTRQPAAPVPRGSDLHLTVGDAPDGRSLDIRTGSGPGAQLNIERDAAADAPRLYLGTLPYFRWAVLYDADAHTIGFKPR